MAKGQVPVDDVISTLERISKEAAGANVPSRTLALLNRCIGAAYLISGKGVPESLREALPYLDRSLAFDPDQLLLRQNVAYLDQFLKAGEGKIYPYFTAVLQVLRGSNDPDIADLAKQMGDWAVKNRATISK